MKDGSTGQIQGREQPPPSIIAGDDGIDALPANTTHTNIGRVLVLRSTRAVTDAHSGFRLIDWGNAVQDKLNYRGLRRWSMLILLPVLLLSAAIAGVTIVLFTVPFGIGAAVLGNMAVMIVVGLVVPACLGLVGGSWGTLTAKRKALKAFGAQRLSTEHEVVQLTANLAQRIGMPPPAVYLYDDSAVNAWATGSNPSNAAVVISRGLIELVELDELAAIIGHELGHIASADIRRMQFALGFQNGVFAFALHRRLKRTCRNLLGWLGELGIKGLSRRREYWADAVGAALTSPDAMQRALKAVHGHAATSRPKKDRYYRELMFHWQGGNLFSSHPTLSQRLSALDEGTFVASVMSRLGRTSTTVRTTDWSRSSLMSGFESLRIFDGLFHRWNRLSDNAVAGLVFALALPLSMLGWQELYFHGPRSTVTTVAETIPDGPRVAGWSSEPAREQKSQTAPTLKSSAPDKVAALPVYPKEPRYEPDDAMGDGELTPYQLLVEEGVACIYRAKLDDGYGSEYLEDAGPDNSDLIVYTLPATQRHADLSLSLVGTQATNCWKKQGGAQQEPDIMKRMQQPYDIWVLTDAQSGATAECGVWPAARYLRPNTGAVAAYCR